MTHLTTGGGRIRRSQQPDSSGFVSNIVAHGMTALSAAFGGDVMSRCSVVSNLYMLYNWREGGKKGGEERRGDGGCGCLAFDGMMIALEWS